MLGTQNFTYKNITYTAKVKHDKVTGLYYSTWQVSDSNQRARPDHIQTASGYDGEKGFKTFAEAMEHAHQGAESYINSQNKDHL